MQNAIYQHINVEHHGKQKRATLCAVKTQEGKVQIGSAICSTNDPYVRRTGRDLALERALKGELQEAAWESWDFDQFLLRIFKYFRTVTSEDVKYKYV